MNHILAENTYFTNLTQWTEHEIIVLKPPNKDQIIRYCHNFENIVIEGFRHHSISLLSKSFSNIVFTEPNIKNCKDQKVNYSNISLFFYLMERHWKLQRPDSELFKYFFILLFNGAS